MGSEPDVLAPLRFEAVVIHWRGPSPFFFAPVPAALAAEIRQISRAVTYGWGMIPVAASIGDIVFRTSLFPKDETYLVPLKTQVRRKCGLTAGDAVAIEVVIQPTDG